MPPHKNHPPIAIRIHRRNVWVSELVSWIFVAVLAVSVILVTGTIFANEQRIASQEAAITHLKASNVEMGDRLERLREKATVASILRSFTKGRIPGNVLVQVVDLVCDNSRTYGYDPLLVLAVIHVESVFDPAALGKKQSGELSGALGLMQIKFETAQEVARDLGIKLDKPEDLLDIEVNMPLGIAYLTRLIAKFRSFRLGVIAFNLGPAAVYELLSTRTPLPMTYYAKTLRNYYQLRKIAQGLE